MGCECKFVISPSRECENQCVAMGYMYCNPPHPMREGPYCGRMAVIVIGGVL